MPYFYLFVVLGLKQLGLLLFVPGRLSFTSFYNGNGLRLASVCRLEGEMGPLLGEAVVVLQKPRRQTETKLEEEASR